MSHLDESAVLESYLFHRHERVRADEEERERQAARRGRDLSIRADDGVTLGATLFGGVEDAPVVVVASATGVLRRFYAPFARWLATEGFTVVTFDYRGIGASRGAANEGDGATMHAWGEQDLASVIAWAAERSGRSARTRRVPRTPGLAPAGRIGVVGHSVGGQLVGLLPEHAASRIGALVTVASQSGDYRLWPMPMRLAMAALWYGLVPGVTRAVGYLPGALGVGADLPAGVALEWARWCRTPGYLVGDSADRRVGFARVNAPLLAYGFHDDAYAPPAAVEALLSLYTHADVTRRRLSASDGRFGHFGFFRARHRRFWREVATHLSTHLSTALTAS